MKTFTNTACLLAFAATLVGCGGKDTLDAPPSAPPPAPPADVSAAPAPDNSVAPPAAPNQPPPPPGTAAPIPAAQETGPQDMFKGMSQREIDEFKANATPETHDMNLGPLIEAINGYHGEFRRYPASQEEMVKARYLPKVLFAPKGKKYVINPQTGEVTVQ